MIIAPNMPHASVNDRATLFSSLAQRAGHEQTISLFRQEISSGRDGELIDVKVEVTDGSFHEVDSNEMAFKMAGIFALKDAFKKANPILLEPIMKVELTTPEEYQGDLIGDVTRRRGAINTIDSKAGQVIVNADVPLAEMFGYATAIRSLSKGRASYSMEPLTFMQVPSSILNAILEQARI